MIKTSWLLTWNGREGLAPVILESTVSAPGSLEKKEKKWSKREFESPVRVLAEDWELPEEERKLEQRVAESQVR